ncbi:MAG: transglutaminase domain-containing protein [Candidatus Micrarchaeota archaeon]
MHVRHRFAAILALGFFSLAFLLFAGCCAYVEPGVNGNQTEPPSNQSTTPPPNRPPVATLLLNKTEAPTPFPMSYTYSCYDPDGNIASCELKIDGRTYAKGENQATLLPKDYQKPDFYGEILKEVGNHTLEITATDSEGLSASQVVEFTVLKGLPLSKPGWYGCNEKPDNPPCDSVMAGYCDKFDEHDMAVRQAAAQAIAKHPGAFSINQLLDIYDYVHANIFYHNVPLDMWPPYYPNQTLATKSGDCKNQAVLIASMVEAIGGSARVLFIPDCQHAFTEVYLGTDIDTSIISWAIGAHYNTNGKGLNYHRSKNSKNQTEYWYIFDTAGGNYPGETIPACLKANYTFEIRDCNRPLDALRAAETQGTAFGPYVDIDETKVLSPGSGWYYRRDANEIGPKGYEWCHFKLAVQSLSPTPLDWHLSDETGYQNWYAHQSYSYSGGQEQVMQSTYEFDWDKPQKFYIILENSNQQNSITVKTQLIETCYKG